MSKKINKFFKKFFFKNKIKKLRNFFILFLIFSFAFSPFVSFLNKNLEVKKVEAAQIAQYSGGLLVYADGTAGTPKYKTFDDTTGFGAEQSASSVGVNAIEWIRVAGSPTQSEWIIVTRDSGDVLKAQVCINVDGGISCGSPTTITATAGIHGFRNFDIAYEQTSGDALLVYGTNTSDELRKIEWTGGAWVNDASITTTRTTGTVEWVELTSRPSSNQIGIAYSDTNDDVSAYRWSGTAVGDEVTTAITTDASTGDVRKFDISFEGTSGDMLVASPLNGAGTTAGGTLSGTTWTISNMTVPDQITSFIDLQEPGPDDDIAMVGHGVTSAGANTVEGYEWSGTALVDGNVALDTSALNWLANYQMAATAYVSSTYYAVAVFGDTTGVDDINWFTMDSAGTWTLQSDNTRTRGNTGFIDLFDYPNANKVLLLTSDSNSDLWADTWDGSTPSSSVWVDRTSGGALETSLTSATTDVVDFAFRLSPVVSSCTSLSTGTWNTAGRWSCGRVPQNGDSVVIGSSHTVTMDVNSASLDDLIINGTLNTSDGISRSLTAKTINIGSTGTLNANASIITLNGSVSPLMSVAGVFNEGTSTIVADTTSVVDVFNVVAEVVDTSSLVSYWKLDESSGTTISDSHGLNNGTLYNATVNQTGKINKAYSFDGTGDYGTLTNSASLSSNNSTYSLWFKSNTATNPASDAYPSLLFKAPDTGFNREISIGFLPSSAYLTARIFDGVSKTSISIDSNVDYYDTQWHHVVVTKEYGVPTSNTDRLTMYVDGNLIGSSSADYHGVQNTANLEIGRTGPTALSNYYFNGLIDEVGVWNNVLSTDEISNLYSSGLGTAYPFYSISNNSLEIYNLTISNANTKTLGANLIVNGNLNIISGILELSSRSLSVAGTTSITGTLNDNSAVGTNLFTGAVTIGSGGTWTNTNNPSYEFRGGLTVNSTSTFTSGSGTYTFSTNAQSIGGTQSYTITNLTNNVTSGNGLTFSTNNPTVTTLIQGINSILTFSGTVPTITTLSATASGNTVRYAGTTQTVKDTTYYNLISIGNGTVFLGNNITINNNLLLFSGTFETSNYSVNSGGVVLEGGTFNMGSSTVFLTGTGTVWTYTSGTVTPGTSTIKLTDTSATAKTFAGGGQTYNNLWLAGGVGGGSYTITGSNTFNDFKSDGSVAHTINFTAGTTTTLSTWTVSGTLGNIVTLQSTSSGNQFTLSDTTGTNTCSYCSIKDSNAVGGAYWDASTESINVSNNLGWIFVFICSSVSSGDWNTASIWDCGRVPILADDVVVSVGHTIDMDTNSNNLKNLVVNGVLNTQNFNLNTETLEVSFTGSFSAGSSIITLNGTTGPLITKHASGTFTAGTSSVVLTGNGYNLTLNSGEIILNNLTLSATGSKILGANLNLNGDLSISLNDYLYVQDKNITVLGDADINGGISFTTQSGTNLFVGAVSVLGQNSAWDSFHSSTDFEFRGGFYANDVSEVSAGNGAVFKFTTNAQTFSFIDSGVSINNLVNEVTLGDGLVFADTNGYIEIGTLTQGINSILTFSGTVPIITTLSATASGNTVRYAGSTQTVKDTTYHNLTVAGTGGGGGGVWTERTTSGQRNWEVIASSSDGTKLISVNYGGGSGGYVYTSTDSGATWTERTSAGLNFWVGAASSSDGTKLIISSEDGYVYTSTDSGANWTERTSIGYSTWYAVASSSDGTKLSAIDANYGYVYTSTDSGVNWTQRTNSGQRAWEDISSSSDGTKLVAVVGNGPGYIYTSADSGATWTERIGAGQRDWESVAISSDGTKIAVGVDSGYIYTSTDSGANWTERTSAGQRVWEKISMSSDGAKIIAIDYFGSGSGGYVYFSNDSGATWTAQTSIGQRSWYGTTISSDGLKMFASYLNGYVYSYEESSPASTATLGGVTTVNGNLTVSAGDLDTANHEVNASSVVINGGKLNSRSSVINLTGTGVVFDGSSGEMEYKTSTMKITDTSSAEKIFNGGGKTFFNLWLMGGAGGGSYTISGNNTFLNDFRDFGTEAHTIKFASGSTQNINQFNVNGSPNKLITITSTDAGNHNLVATGGNILVNYLDVSKSVASGRSWEVERGVDNNSAGSGWVFRIYRPRHSGGGDIEEPDAPPDEDQGGGGPGDSGGDIGILNKKNLFFI